MKRVNIGFKVPECIAARDTTETWLRQLAIYEIMRVLAWKLIRKEKKRKDKLWWEKAAKKMHKILSTGNENGKKLKA